MSSMPLLAIAATALLLGFDGTCAESLPPPPLNASGEYAIINASEPLVGDPPSSFPKITIGDVEFSLGCSLVIAFTCTLTLACFLMSFAFKSSGENQQGTLEHSDACADHSVARKWAGDPAAMQDDVESALERERYMRIDCLSLYFNRPWRHRQGPEVEVASLCSNAEWMGGERFPAGHRVRSGGRHDVLGMSLATWRFFWRRKTEISRKCLMLEVVEGLCPAASCVVLSMLVTMLHQMSGSLGSHQSAFNYGCLAFGYVLVQLIQDRCHYVFEKDVPGASVRQELKQRLQYEFLQLQKLSPEAWPPGRCMEILDSDVHLLVNNVWLAVFDLADQVTRLASLVVMVFWHLRNAKAIQITLAVTYLFLACGIINTTISRKRGLVDIAMRRRDSAFAMFSAATRQVHEASQGHLELGTGRRDALEAATFFGKVAMVYRKRAFHFLFVRLVSLFANKEMMTLAQGAVMVILGTEVIEGRISAGGVVGTFAAMGHLATAFENLNGVWLDLIEGFPSLLCIAHIFNQGAGFVDDAGHRSDDLSVRDSGSDAELGLESSLEIGATRSTAGMLENPEVGMMV